MDRIKSIDKMMIQPDMVFAEIIAKPKSAIIVPGQEEEVPDYLVVRHVGEGVKYTAGDVIIRFNPIKAMAYEYKGKRYINIPQSLIVFACKPEDFDANAIEPKSKLTLN